MNRILSCLLLAASMVIPSLASAAADFPVRPVTIITGFNAGGSTDIILRAMQADMEKELGQPVLIVNKGGNGGAVAIGELLTKPEDGYTVGLVNSTAFTLDPQLKKVRFGMDDFVFLGTAGGPQEGFFSLADKPWKDFKGMIEYMKKEGKEFTLCSPAAIDMMLMKAVAAKEGIKFRKVPVKSGSETVTQLLGEHVDVGYGGGIQTAYIKAGKMINLASSTTVPFIKFPDCDTLTGLGYENCGYDNQFVFFVKKDAPGEACRKLADVFYKVANLPAIQDVIANKANVSPKILRAEEVKPLLKKQFTSYSELVKYK